MSHAQKPERRRRPKPYCSKLFEQLSNEIFVEIFSYLSGIDAIIAFAKLNHRFRCLVFEYCQSFDFQSISRSQFDFIFQHHDTKQWKSLRISDDKQTPDFVEYFSQVYSLINDFPQLKSFAIVNLNLSQNYTIFSRLSSLTNLVSLKIESVCGANMFPFDLPNLKKLVLISCANIHWIKNFSQVESIEYTIVLCYSRAKDFIWPSKLKHLKINFITSRDYDLILHSLDRLTSLITLELDQQRRGYFIPNGQLWENLIRSSLPLLKIFKFYFQFERHPLTASNFHQLLASFSTPFYVEEKNWFVQADRYDITRGRLFSIPYLMKRFTTGRNSTGESVSTYPTTLKNIYHTNKYANVETLEINHTDAEPDENLNRTKIINLIVRVDFDFIKWISVLTSLRHLDIPSYVRISSHSFGLLLQTTSHLSSLNIEKNLLRKLTEDWSHVLICNYLSEKIRNLKLDQMNQQFWCLSQNEVRQIIRIFGSKCQHLSLTIQFSNETIISILENMSQLRSLHLHISGKKHESPDMIWLEKQKIKFNNLNSRIISIMNDWYFWL